MKVVPNWREAWKWFSLWCMGLSSAFLSAWALLPDDLKPYLLGSLPPKQVAVGVSVMLLVGMVGRFVDQAKK